MKKTSAKSARRGRPTRHNVDEIPAEIDFSGAVRNPYAARYATGSNIVMLEPPDAVIVALPPPCIQMLDPPLDCIESLPVPPTIVMLEPPLD